jgi:uracil-DNA glycosylase
LIEAPDRDSLAQIHDEVVVCRKCPRLVAHREAVARDKRAAYVGQEYWGRPVPGFGEPNARLLVLGLAPAAHGGNRTGRIFTGDRSGDWLYGALWKAGFANQPTSVSRDDGLQLIDAWVTAAVKCAPPDNRPTIQERDNCEPYLVREIAALSRLRVVVALGAFAWAAALRVLTPRPRPTPRFGHGVEAQVGAVMLLGCYHPSQQNTFTGKLTEPMIDAVLARARELLADQAEAGVLETAPSA